MDEDETTLEHIAARSRRRSIDRTPAESPEGRDQWDIRDDGRLFLSVYCNGLDTCDSGNAGSL